MSLQSTLRHPKKPEDRLKSTASSSSPSGSSIGAGGGWRGQGRHRTGGHHHSRVAWADGEPILGGGERAQPQPHISLGSGERREGAGGAQLVGLGSSTSSAGTCHPPALSACTG